MRDHPIQVNAGDPGTGARRNGVGDPAVVTLLRAMLERAERGELVSVALAAETAVGGVSTAFALGERGKLFSLAGATAELQRRLLTEIADGD